MSAKTDGIIHVQLTWAEVSMGANVGMLRNISSLKKQLANKHGARPDDSWHLNIEGAIGEVAVCKALGIYFVPTVDTFHSRSDLPGGVEVRTRSQLGYELIIRRSDPKAEAFILVVGTAPNYTVVGWCTPEEGKRPEYIQRYGDREASWFVPQDKLHNILEIAPRIRQAAHEQWGVA